jgi:hypothetical protein
MVPDTRPSLAPYSATKGETAAISNIDIPVIGTLRSNNGILVILPVSATIFKYVARNNFGLA